jgi:hypothetical protein
VDPEIPNPSGPADEGGSGGQPNPRQLNVSVPEDIKLGTYANFLVVSHSPHEFTLDFCQVLPGRENAKVKAEVVSRVKVAPTVVGKIIRALNTNMTAYEDKYGLVREIG